MPPPPPPPPGAPGMPPPPPPPPGMPGFAGQQKLCIPKVETRRFVWEKLSDDSLSKTLWAKQDKMGMEEKLQNIGIFQQVESLFGKAPPGKKRESAGLGDRDGKDKDGVRNEGKGEHGQAPKEEIITLIDGKRAQNLMIALGRLKHCTPQSLSRAILAVDETILTESLVVQLLGLVPTKDERAMMESNKHPLHRLSKADQFMFELMKIEHLRERLQAIHFKLTCGERFDVLGSDIDTALKAYKGLSSANSFHELLKLILTIGNHLNFGSRLGGVGGFKISTLNKLADTKAHNKRSLLHFVALNVESKLQHLKGFLEELKDVIPGSKVSLPNVKSNLKEVCDEVRQLKAEVDYQIKQQKEAKANEGDSSKLTSSSEGSDQSGNISSSPSKLKSAKTASGHLDRFLEIFTPVLEHAQARVSELESSLKKTESLFREVAVLYGEEEALQQGKLSPEDFLMIFKTFIESYKMATIENAKDAERERAIEKRKKAQEERENARRLRQEQQKMVLPLPLFKMTGASDKDSSSEGTDSGNSSSDAATRTTPAEGTQQGLGVMDLLMVNIKQGASMSPSKPNYPGIVSLTSPTSNRQNRAVSGSRRRTPKGLGSSGRSPGLGFPSRSNRKVSSISIQMTTASDMLNKLRGESNNESTPTSSAD
ncbi:Dishevelled associated activator of morphogenesis 2 [Quaeritorhiza haematococci]|nr:Dishevelled associated activator of morphogenesis 2 [Quaeritorhiza haematococci]